MTVTLRHLVPPKQKYLTPKHGKNMQGKSAGQSGNKHSKRHDRVSGPPGTPNGTCIKAREDAKKAHLREKCYCGKHNKRRA